MIAYDSLSIIDVTDGKDGANFRTFTTAYNANQSTMESWARLTQSTWNVKESTADTKAGDTVLFRCFNTSKNGYSYVMATVLSVLSDKSLSAKSIGLLDKGDSGQTLYTWHMYADDKEGNGMTSDSTGKAYVGVAYNQETETPPEDVDPSIFTWSLWEPPPVEVTEQIAQYCFGDIPADENVPPVSPSKDDARWSITAPNPWAPENLDANDDPKYYVWRRYETHWSNGDKTYVGLMILDDYEIANILAQQAGFKNVGAWCKDQNITIIDGSTIMTGTISADKIDANFVSTLDLEVGNQVKMGSNAKISWDNVTDKDSVASKDDVSKITETTITTKELSAKNLKVEAANINGTLTADQIKIEINGRNLAHSNFINHTATVNTDERYSWNITKDSAYLGTCINGSIFKVGETYTLSFYFQKTDGTLKNIGGHIAGYTLSSQYVDGQTTSGYGDGISVADDTSEHYVVITFKANKNNADNNVYIQPNRGDNTSVTYKLWNIQVEKGNKATDWRPASDDLGGWYVDSSGVYMKDVSGDRLVGMHSSDSSSAVTEETLASPIRFYAGVQPTLSDSEKEITTILHFEAPPTVKYTSSQTIVLTAEKQASYFIMSASAPEKIESSGQKSIDVTLESYRDESNRLVYQTQQVELFPSWLTKEDATITCSDDRLKVTYNGGNVVTVEFAYLHLVPTSVHATITGSYKFIETLQTKVSHTDSSIQVTFTTGSRIKPYDIPVTYTLGRRKPKFTVFEDGSLYATEANITGEIVANTGSIGGLSINNNSISSGDDGLTFTDAGVVIAKELNVSDLTIGTMFGSNSNTGKVKYSLTLSTQKDTTNGIVEVTLQAPVVLTAALSRGVYVDYDYTSQLYHMTIPKGQQSVSVQAPLTLEKYGETYTYDDNCWINGSSVFYQAGNTGNTEIISGSCIVPESASLNLGRDADKTWNYIYYRTSCTKVSDRKIKDNIVPMPLDYCERLINGLVPISYTIKTAPTPRQHYGFIAQEVEELLHSLGTSADEVGLVCKSQPGEPDSEDNHYSLDYTSFIAPMVSVIQQLSKRVEELENKLNTTQND